MMQARISELTYRGGSLITFIYNSLTFNEGVVMATKSPNYIKLYETLKGQITEGHFPVGSQIPTEEKLCQSLAASRYSVREALQKLENEGLIKRRRGSGSTVMSRMPSSTFRHGMASREDLMSYASATRMEWHDQDLVRTDGKLARLLGCDEMREWQRMRGTRYEEDGHILALVEVFVDTERATIPEKTDFGARPIYEWLEKHHGLAPFAVSQDIRATRLTRNQAEQLGETPDASVLEVIRRYFDNDNSIYLISRSTYRSRDFVLNHRFQLEAVAD